MQPAKRVRTEAITSNTIYFICDDEKNITNFIIPTGVHKIRLKPLRASCTSFTSVVLPDTLTDIGPRSFDCCEDLKSLTLPTGLTIIGYFAFHRCRSLTSIVFPDTLTRIGSDAFAECTGLTYLKFPNEISIGASAFRSCYGLTSIVLPNSLINVSNGLFLQCTGITNITLPDTLKTIGANSFAACTGLTSIRLPDMLIAVERAAFKNCTQLTFVSLPHTLTHFGNNCFAYCTGLGPNSVVFRPPVGRASFTAWAVSNMRNRDNYEITTVKRLRNIIRLITEFSLTCRNIDEATMDPDGNNRAFGEIDYPQPHEYTIKNGEMYFYYE